MNFLRVGARFAQGRAPQTSGGESETTRQRRVVMLVANPCVNDSRVIRAAESVAAEGHEVFVLAMTAKGVPDNEVRNGVTYNRRGLANAGNMAALGRLPSVTRLKPKLAEMSRRLLPSRLVRFAVKYGRALLRHRVVILAIGAVGGLALGRLNWSDVRPPDGAQWSAIPRFPLIAGFGIAIVTAGFFASRGRERLKKAYRATGQFVRSNLRVAYTALRSEALFKEPMRDLKPDVIHAHDFATLPVAAKVARETGAVCIYDSHELEMHRNIKRSKFDRMLCGKLERRYIRAVDGVITVCDSIADHLADHYRIARPTVVMNAPSFAEIDGSERDVRSDLGLAADTPLAIYVGSITIGRGIETIVRSLRDLPKFHLVLLGPANKTTLEAALAIAQSDGTADRLHVLPPVAPNAVVSYIRSADVSLVLIQNVCLSYYFCLPNKLVESTIAGLPVVASDFPEMKRFVEKTRTGVVTNERDAAAIARSIQEAYDRRHELRPDEERKIIIEKFYGWETQRRRMVEVYETLLDARESRAPAP